MPAASAARGAGPARPPAPRTPPRASRPHRPLVHAELPHQRDEVRHRHPAPEPPDVGAVQVEDQRFRPPLGAWHPCLPPAARTPLVLHSPSEGIARFVCFNRLVIAAYMSIWTPC